MWNDQGIGKFLDDYLVTGGEKGWLNRLAPEAFPGSGDAGAFGCSSREQPCLSSLKGCSDMAAIDRAKEFWVFNAVQKLQVCDGWIDH